MPLRFALACTLALSSGLSANTANDIDTQSVEWLLSQISIGEAQQNKKLVEDSLRKLVAIAPARIETQCAVARYDFANGESAKANQLLNKIDNGLTKQTPCVEKLKVLSRTEGKDKSSIQEAKLLARAGRYKQAREIYNNIFKNVYPTLDYELEHLSWYGQDSGQWESVKKGYEKLAQYYPSIAQIEVAYARHLLRRNLTDKKAIDILSKYGAGPTFINEVEYIWLSALLEMPLTDDTVKQYQRYFTLYPFSSKGELQYQDFLKDYKKRQTLLADPAYQLWVRGDRLLEKNKLAAAEPLLLKALRGRPQDGAIMRSLGTLYLRLGENQKSYQYFTRAQKFTAEFAERETLQELAKTAKLWLYIREAKNAINNKEFKTAKLKLDLAATLGQETNTVIYNKGLLQFAQGQYSQAALTYQIVLKSDPLNRSALIGLLEIAELEQNEQALTSFYNSLSFNQKKLVKDSYSVSLSSQYRAKADALTQSGDLELAEKVLKDAIEIAPEQPWLYYDLAFIYQQKGLTEEARTLFNNVLWQFPLNPQIRYSHALFLRSLDDYQGAIKTLQYIPFKSRDKDIIALEQQLQLNESLTQSERHLDAKDKATAIYHLSNLEAQSLTPAMQAELSRSWYRIDEKKHAIRLINKALKAEPSLSPYWHTLYGEWLLDQGDENKTKQWFENYTLPESATENEKTQYVQLQNSYITEYYNGSDLIAKLNQLDQKYKNTPATTTALINANLALEQREAAVILYQQKVQNKQTIEPQALLAIANAYIELGDDFQAKEVTQKAITQTTPQDGYLQRQIMSSLNEFNYSGDALYLAKQLIEKSPNDQELRYLGAQVASKFNETEQAQFWYAQTLSPNRTLNEKELYGALLKINESDEWYVNGAKRELINEQNKNQAYIAIGVNFSGQTSTESEATLGAGLVPIEAYFPLWQGQGFIKVDPTTISAQTTRFDEQFAGSRYGQGALCIFTCSVDEVTPEENGVDIGIGWQNENWRVDVGTTPLGFLIEDFVWGVNYADSFGDFGYSLELEKRPVTSSVLSYAGLKDVNTGEVWGGVRSTGLTANVSHDLGGKWGFWSSADFTLYKGQNVKDNQRYRMMGGTYYRVISNQEREFTVGASLLHWAYKYNLSEETWGHGGYYSPQNYVGLSVPLTYDARWGDDFVYRLKTGISYSQTKTQSIDFFPNDSDLQIAAYDRESITGVDPVFEGETSSGVSYNLEGSFEYRITPNWFFGGYLAIDRSDFYEPNFGQLYIRYYFNPVYGTLEFPGTPIVPYAEF
ncbi:cellulose synthase subunit BcsC-related outer membrane protein [Pseudoalteromonas sp. SR43-2]|uniref:cellulose synthase subunit BcsC-related outer membrane protein n=1 Tax=Pseudoalteromonas sp. SR43-2 TaxID=2760944 RepID=UPI0015FD365B|nr:cellulose synthase subunit BcsC-related outer membrane protein [Pseudoalteromonas sp. SR43-2]MBB1377385.1 BCSC C-terminal domain-containing protein [Pseudoalteromonas sp. SR43-2]